jgi:hypothetical protein
LYRQPEIRERENVNWFIRSMAGLFLAAYCAGADTLVVSGLVTREGSAVVIRNALVVVTMGSAAGIARQDSAYTDALGRYLVSAVSVSPKVKLSILAQGFQPAENTVNVLHPADGVADSVHGNFALRPVNTYSDTIGVSGTVADASSRKALANCLVIAKGFSGVGGAAVVDTVKSDSEGRFVLRLLSVNHYYPTLLFEKDGYRTFDRQVAIGTSNIQIDTVYLVKFTTADSITYVVSGAVTDTSESGIRGAVVIVRISNGTTLLYAGKDTTSQWGGYYSVSTKKPYSSGSITVEVRVDKTGYFSKDTLQTLPSSTPTSVMNVVLWSTTAAALPVVRVAPLRNIQSAAVYSIDGRYRGIRASTRQTYASAVYIVGNKGTAQTRVQLKK